MVDKTFIIIVLSLSSFLYLTCFGPIVYFSLIFDMSSSSQAVDTFIRIFFAPHYYTMEHSEIYSDYISWWMMLALGY